MIKFNNISFFLHFCWCFFVVICSLHSVDVRQREECRPGRNRNRNHQNQLSPVSKDGRSGVGNEDFDVLLDGLDGDTTGTGSSKQHSADMRAVDEKFVEYLHKISWDISLLTTARLTS